MAKKDSKIDTINKGFRKNYGVTLDFGEGFRIHYIFMNKTKNEILTFLQKNRIGEAVKEIIFSELIKMDESNEVFDFLIVRECSESCGSDEEV